MTETKDPRPPIEFITPEELFERLVLARKEVGREIGMRKSVYRRWVSNGTLSVENATAQMFAMFDAYAILKKLEVARDEFEAKLRAADRALFVNIGDAFRRFCESKDEKPEIAEEIQALIAAGKGEATK